MADIFSVSVSQLNRRLSLIVSSDKALNDLYIHGEISNFTLHRPSGHIYFTLKDEQSAIKCVMFKNNAASLTFMPEAGMSVIVHGRVGVYERDGANQIYVSELFTQGAGKLYLEFLKTKEELEKGGYFAKKRELPDKISSVCIITSEKAAALQDMLNVISERCPLVKITLIPALVQGDSAPLSLIAALKKAQNTNADVIIIGRGGGSAEDLSAFNDRALAIELFSSDIPTISAVGHETDYSITDLVADKRAPTPTAAAVLVTPYTLEDIFAYAVSRRELIAKRLISRLDDSASRLELSERNISALSPAGKIDRAENELKLIIRNVTNSANSCIARYNAELDKKAEYISAINPLNVLVRGYSITMKDKKVITDAKDISEGDILDITLSKGNITARAINSDRKEQ